MRGIMVSYRANGRDCRGPVLDVVYLPVAAPSGVLHLPKQPEQSQAAGGLLSLVLVPVRLEDGKIGAVWLPMSTVRIEGEAHDTVPAMSIEVWHGDGSVWGGGQA